MYVCLAMNTSAPTNIDAPIAQPAIELNCDWGGYDFRQCGIGCLPLQNNIRAAVSCCLGTSHAHDPSKNYFNPTVPREEPPVLHRTICDTATPASTGDARLAEKSGTTGISNTPSKETGWSGISEKGPYDGPAPKTTTGPTGQGSKTESPEK